MKDTFDDYKKNSVQNYNMSISIIAGRNFEFSSKSHRTAVPSTSRMRSNLTKYPSSSNINQSQLSTADNDTLPLKLKLQKRKTAQVRPSVTLAQAPRVFSISSKSDFQGKMVKSFSNIKTPDSKLNSPNVSHIRHKSDNSKITNMKRHNPPKKFRCNETPFMRSRVFTTFVKTPEKLLKPNGRRTPAIKTIKDFGSLLTKNSSGY